MSTVWVIVEAPDEATLISRVAALRSAYLGKRVRGRDNPREDEKIGSMRYNNTRTKAFTGTSRATLGNIADLASERAWLAITPDPAFMRDAEWHDQR